MMSWDELTPLQRGVQGLGGMYGAYLAVGKLMSSVFMQLKEANCEKGVFMAVDCHARLDRILSKQKGIEPITKKKL